MTLHSRTPLARALARILHSAGGFPALQDAIGVGKHAWNYGLPDSVTSERGRVVIRDRDVRDPESVGSIISLPSDASSTDLEHEMRHSDQADVLGPAMIAAKPVEALLGYGRGPLERDAYRATEPSSEFVRKPLSGYTALIERLLQSTLGR